MILRWKLNIRWEKGRADGRAGARRQQPMTGVKDAKWLTIAYNAGYDAGVRDMNTRAPI